MATNRPIEVEMATNRPIEVEMLDKLCQITRNISLELYDKLKDALCISENVYTKFTNAESYFKDQLLKNELRPWDSVKCLRIFGNTAIAEDLKDFAEKFKFPENEHKIPTKATNPKLAIFNLLKKLKSELAPDQLLKIRFCPEEKFEPIFRDINRKFSNPSSFMLTLKERLEEVDRNDLAQLVSAYFKSISTMDTSLFKRTVHLYLDSMDVDILPLLAELKSALKKEHSTFHSLDEKQRPYSLRNDYIPLKFTKEVDTKTLPLSEGADAELQTLMSHTKGGNEPYINAHKAIYSMEEKLVCIVGHPGTGKTLFCRKLINDYAFNEPDVTYRFVLFIACRDGRWHNLEKEYQKDADNETMFPRFLDLMITENATNLIKMIIDTKGRNLLLIIDSFDEFPNSKLDSTLLYQILVRRLIPESTILITSRPGAWNQLIRGFRRYLDINSSWQVIGFSPENRDKFIDKMLASDEKINKCKQFLNNKPEIDILTLVPVNISLITNLVKKDATLSRINTLTDMYTTLVEFSLDEELIRNDEKSGSIVSLFNMPLALNKEFSKLTDLSYNGILNRKITFSPNEFPEINEMGSKYKQGLGLFRIINVKTDHNTTANYLSCIHLTYQEFLAAFYLSQKSHEELVKIVKKIFIEDRWASMKVCIRFLCGIMKERSREIIQIIVEKLHKQSSIISCKGLFFDSDYYSMHHAISYSHLSVLLYVLETKDSGILREYSKKLLPHGSIPHFYLELNLSPVDINCISEYSIKLSQERLTMFTSIRIDITPLNISNMDLDKVLKTITSYTTSIDTLIVIFRSVRSDYLHYAKKHYRNHISELIYELLRLHLSEKNRNKLEDELLRINSNQSSIKGVISDPDLFSVFKLKFILMSLKLSVYKLNFEPSVSNYEKLFNLISRISKETDNKKPKQIYYHFQWTDLLDNSITTELIKRLHGTATYAMFSWCTFSPQFLESFVDSQPGLEYLHIKDDTLSHLRPLFSQPLATEELFKKLKKRNMKGLYLTNVTLQNESNLFDCLKAQTRLEEIHLENTTSNTPEVLRSIQGLTTLKYLQIPKPPSEESSTLLLEVLTTNRPTLSYLKFSSYGDYLRVKFVKIMLLLSSCIHLQYIDFSDCHLTSQHLQSVATVINQLSKLVYIDMTHNSFSDDGLIHLYEPLNTNTNVRIIDLSGCNINNSMQTINAIKSLVEKCVNVQKIDLHGNKFTKPTKEELRKFAKESKITLRLW